MRKLLSILRTPLLAAAVVGVLLQAGGQLFAISVVVRQMVAEPPRSFSVLEGPFGYDSSFWWDTVPNVTFTLLLVALVVNWASPRRGLLLASLGIFIVTGLTAVFVLDPIHAEVIAGGFSDTFDPALRDRARIWYRVDWMVCGLTALSGIVALAAVTRAPDQSPARGQTATRHDGGAF